MIDEVRELRRQLLERFDGDPHGFAEYLRELERQHPQPRDPKERARFISDSEEA